MSIKAVRGAVSVENDSPDCICNEVIRLMSELLKMNKLKTSRIISIQFSLTPDIQSLNPAAALRKSTENFERIPLFVAQEPVVQGSLPKIIRVMITYKHKWGTPVVPVYLGEAQKLRPDLSIQ